MRKKDNFINHAKITLPSLSVNESLSRSFIASFMMQTNPTVEEISDVKCAVSEAVTNAIVHGYEGKKGLITINAKLTNDGCVVIDISDKGKGIEDIEKARRPMFTTNTDGERSGMGFTVMETFTDSLKVFSKVNKGTRVRLTKRIGRSDT